LLDVPGLGLRLLTDVSGADRVIRHVYTTDLPDPSRYLTPGDLVLTGMIWCREPGDADRFVRALARSGVGVLGAASCCPPCASSWLARARGTRAQRGCTST
jgi:hypothetical protein